MEILPFSTDTIPNLNVWSGQLGGPPFPLLSDYWPHWGLARPPVSSPLLRLPRSCIQHRLEERFRRLRA